MRDYKGLNILKKETEEETIKRLENELQLEKIGRTKDLSYFENELELLSKEFLLVCDDGYCKGDASVGDSPCRYYDDERGCILKYRYE